MFLIFAAVCLLALVFVYRYVPETKDRDFEQIDTDLQARAHPAGVQRARLHEAGSAGSPRVTSPSPARDTSRPARTSLSYKRSFSARPARWRRTRWHGGMTVPV